MSDCPSVNINSTAYQLILTIGKLLNLKVSSFKKECKTTTFLIDTAVEIKWENAHQVLCTKLGSVWAFKYV